MRKILKNFGELLVVMAPVVNSIQFLLFSLVGIDYDPENGGSGGLVAKLNVGFCLYCMAWVFIHENKTKPVYNVQWPYYMVFIPVLLFFLEDAFFNIGMDSFSGKQMTFYGVFSVPAVYLATYMYRYDRFDMIARYSDIIILLCTLALAMNLPNMIKLSSVSIGGAGNHQSISYSAAFCFALTLSNLLSDKNECRFQVFKSKFMRYVFFAILPLLAIICFMGGGRGGSFLLVFSFVSCIFMFSQKHFARTMFIGVLGILSFMVIAGSSGVFEDGFGRAFDYIQGGSVNLTVNQSDVARTALRNNSFRLIIESPFIGYGLWNGLKVSGYYMHNVFLDVAISGGIFYLIFFIYVMKKAFKSAYRLIRYDTKHGLLMAWMLYPTVMLMFSGFYLTCGIFMFCVTYSLLYSKKSKYL